MGYGWNSIYFIYYSNTFMSIFVLFRPKTTKTRFLTDSLKRTRKGQGKDKERTRKGQKGQKGQGKDMKGQKGQKGQNKDKKRTRKDMKRTIKDEKRTSVRNILVFFAFQDPNPKKRLF